MPKYWGKDPQGHSDIMVYDIALQHGIVPSRCSGYGGYLIFILTVIQRGEILLTHPE